MPKESIQYIKITQTFHALLTNIMHSIDSLGIIYNACHFTYHKNFGAFVSVNLDYWRNDRWYWHEAVCTAGESWNIGNTEGKQCNWIYHNKKITMVWPYKEHWTEGKGRWQAWRSSGRLTGEPKTRWDNQVWADKRGLATSKLGIKNRIRFCK